jgi:hypothetical protein
MIQRRNRSHVINFCTGIFPTLSSSSLLEDHLSRGMDSKCRSDAAPMTRFGVQERLRGLFAWQEQHVNYQHTKEGFGKQIDSHSLRELPWWRIQVAVTCGDTIGAIHGFFGWWEVVREDLYSSVHIIHQTTGVLEETHSGLFNTHDV